MKTVSTMRARCAALLLASACSGTLAASGAASSPTTVTFAVQGATQTYGLAINAGGDVAGMWYNSANVPHGYLRTADGTVTSFDPPGATETTISGINDAQWVVGSFSDGAYEMHGFLRAPDGTITVYDAPGSAGYTQILCIGNDNAFAGNYARRGLHRYGFVVDQKGRYRSFSVGTRDTSAFAINAKGAVAGLAVDSRKSLHGFVRDRRGETTVFDVPGGDDMLVWGINIHGDVAGVTYQDYVNNTGQGFLRLSDGTIQTFKVISGYGTAANGLNDKDEICGVYYDAAGHYHGYTRKKNGVVTSFDVGTEGASGCWGINASGQTTGYFDNSDGIPMAFLRTP